MFNLFINKIHFNTYFYKYFYKYFYIYFMIMYNNHIIKKN